MTDYLLFSMVWGFFCGLNAIGGHELLHKKEMINKVAGTWTYTKFFYSHFLDEHIKGHHKTVATLEDPATARKNESVWAFIPRSFFGSHWNCW
jgi:alkane 1-monooxygenase